jgi:hypothetical protein
VARETRRQIQELITDGDVLPGDVLWNPPLDAEYPPFFSLYLSCTDALEERLGLSPKDLRIALCAEGIWAEPGFAPTHRDPAWRSHAEGHDLPYDGSGRVYDRAVFVHTKFLRHPRFADWLREIMERVVAHKDGLRGIGERIPQPVW